MISLGDLDKSRCPGQFFFFLILPRVGLASTTTLRFRPSFSGSLDDFFFVHCRTVGHRMFLHRITKLLVTRSIGHWYGRRSAPQSTDVTARPSFL